MFPSPYLTSLPTFGVERPLKVALPGPRGCPKLIASGHAPSPPSIDDGALDGHRLAITTRVLPVKLCQWDVNEKAVSVEERKSHEENIYGILADAEELLGIFTYNKNSHHDRETTGLVLDRIMPQDLEISIRILIDTLSAFGRLPSRTASAFSPSNL